jgi:hypothetical protein
VIVVYRQRKNLSPSHVMRRLLADSTLASLLLEQSLIVVLCDLELVLELISARVPNLGRLVLLGVVSGKGVSTPAIRTLRTTLLRIFPNTMEGSQSLSFLALRTHLHVSGKLA